MLQVPISPTGEVLPEQQEILPPVVNEELMGQEHGGANELVAVWIAVLDIND